MLDGPCPLGWFLGERVSSSLCGECPVMTKPGWWSGEVMVEECVHTHTHAHTEVSG